MSQAPNLRQFFQGGERERAQALEFDAWLNAAVCAPPLSARRGSLAGVSPLTPSLVIRARST